MNSNVDDRTLVYLEYKPGQIYYINGFKEKDILDYLVDGWAPTGLYALWDDFSLIFRKTNKIPDTEKFYYPVPVSRWEVREIFHKIEIDSQIIKRVKAGQCKIILINPYEGWTWSWWNNLADILKKKFDLVNDHIVFMSANYCPNNDYSTIVFNTWERQIYQNYSTKEHLDRSLLNINKPRPHSFICLNRRPSIHRYSVVTQLFKYRKNGILTCAKNGSYSEWYQNWVEENFLEEYPELSDTYKNEIKPNLPLTYDDGINPEIDNPASNEWGKIDKYYQSYLYVVTETFFEGKAQGEDTLFLSEKIFKPIIFFQPFVVFGRPGTIKLLNSLGYKTFGDYIDESYDSIEDDKKRLYAAIKSIKRFIKIPQERKKFLMRKMQPLFMHNYSRLKENHDFNIYENLRQDLRKTLDGK